MTTKSSEVTTTKVHFASNRLFGVALVVLGVVLLANGKEWMWPVISIVAGVGFLTIGQRVVAAPCPSCGGSISHIPDHASYIVCPKCENLLWNRKGENRVELIDENFVADEPMFKWVLPWNGFSLPGVTEAYGVIGGAMLKTSDAKRLEAKWPEGCCVCGAASDHRESLSKKFRVTPGSKSGMIRSPISVDVSVFVEDIPHCRLHSAGAELKVASSAYGESNGCLVFRSYPYYRAFRKLNK